MTQGPNSKLLAVIRAILEPIARFCVQRTITIQDFEECAKQAFVLAARQECARKGDKVTMSRLSAITGLHRRDVSRLEVAKEAKDPAQNVPLRVVGLWLTHSSYTTKAGKPRLLTFGNEGSEFSKLVAKVSKNIHAGSVLAELERLEIVRQRGEFLKLARRGFEPRGDALQILKYLAQDTSDLFAAVEDNLAAEKPENLHATTEYDSIPQEREPAVRAWILQQGALFHQRVRKFLAKLDQDSRRTRDKSKVMRVVVGTFSRISLPEDEGES